MAKFASGQVLEINGDKAMVQFLKERVTSIFVIQKFAFWGHPLELGVSPDMMGRVFTA